MKKYRYHFAVPILLLYWNSIYAQIAVPQIVGGSTVDISTAPWMAAIINDSDGHVNGAGSIISHHWILTAAHIFSPSVSDAVDLQASDFKIHVGANNPKDNSSGTFYTADTVIIYPGYDADTNHIPDVALIHIPETIAYGTDVQPVRFATYSNTPDSLLATGTNAYLIGWGFTNINNTNPNNTSTTLQRVLMQSIGINNYTGGSLAFEESGAGAMPGDSGGPAYIYDSNGNPIVIGICSSTQYPQTMNPNYYTSVRYYFLDKASIYSIWQSI